MQKNNSPDQNDRGQDIIAGRNAITEALRAERPIDSLLIARGSQTGKIGAIIAACRDNGIPIKEVAPEKLDHLCKGTPHQGVAAIAAAHSFSTLDDIFASAEKKGEPPFIIIADNLQDPHNLGAIIRTAEGAGAHGIIIPKRRSVSLTYAVGKASAGAIEYMPVARVSNLAGTVEELKKRGMWVFGADIEGKPWCQADLSGPIALVIGGEDAGIGKLLKEKCDFLVSLPMQGKINSLNASVACGILMYEVTRQRLKLKAIQ